MKFLHADKDYKVFRSVIVHKLSLTKLLLLTAYTTFCCCRSAFSFGDEAEANAIADNDNEAAIDGLDDANSYGGAGGESGGGGGGGAYADPRCEMKKRQQQEIVVSGLTINTSDISSGEELAAAAASAATAAAATAADEDNGVATMTEQTAVQLPADYSIHSNATATDAYIFGGDDEDLGSGVGGGGGGGGKMMLDQSSILMSRLIEPSVRKIGGGGAVSMSAFQVSTLYFCYTIL